MTPGYLNHITPKVIRCSFCGGRDIGSVGVIHHTKYCVRNPYCAVCGLELLVGEKRFPGMPMHLDCGNEYLEHLDEEHA